MKCFEAFSKYDVECNKKDCKYWIKHCKDLNCTLLAAKKSPKTLDEIAGIFDLTKMRICQIEHAAISKMKKTINI